MKIAHLYTGGGEVYGAERVILHLSCEQLKNRIDTEVVYFKRPGVNSFLKLLNDHNIPVRIINSKSKIDMNAFLTLKRVLLHSSPQIIHSHGYKGDIFTALLRNFNHKYKIISTKHGSTYSSSQIRIYDYLGDSSLKFFDKVIAVSNFTKERLIEKHIPEEKIEVIHNGIDITLYNHKTEGKLRTELNLPPDSKLLGFIGRFGPEKGIIYLLEAARILCRKKEGVYFVLVGDGQLWEEAEAFISLNKLKDRIIMLGWRNDATDLLADMNALLLPSLTEGTPMVILESMSLGVPVIASDVGGISEVIDNLKTGLLLKPRDPEAIADAISYLIGNRELAENISQNSIHLVQTHFSSHRMSELYTHTYHNLLNGVTRQ